MAKIICPDYDVENEHWQRVIELSREIDNLKKEMASEESKKLSKCQIQLVKRWWNVF